MFRNYPLEQIHKWSMIGAKYLDCVGRESDEAVWKFIATVYEHQGEITTRPPSHAEGLRKGCGRIPTPSPPVWPSRRPRSECANRWRLGRKLDVTSTPTLFINGRKVVGFGNNTPYDAVKGMVEFNLPKAAK